MEEKFKAFLSWTYTRETLAARSKILQDITRFILAGAEHPYERPAQHPQHSTFTDAVRSRVLAAYEMQMTIPKRYKPVEGDTYELVIEAYREGQHSSMYRDRLATVPFSNDDLRAKFSDAFGCGVLETWKDVPSSVSGAYTRALQNLTQTDTRLVSLYAIHQLLRESEFAYSGDLAGFAEIGQTLRIRRQKFLLDTVMFGGLLGGETAKHVIQLLALEHCHKEDKDDIQYSLIHFLQADGKSPGSWSGTVEGDLRKDIRKKFNVLKESNESVQ